uniref:C-type lectin domain-containing protein n=1 Tax=Macrostomum lignano TaxID=282301 RepID=A0A1I8INJ7_9PLAT
TRIGEEIQRVNGNDLLPEDNSLFKSNSPSGSKDEDCLRLTNNREMADKACDTRLGFVCEFASQKVPNSTAGTWKVANIKQELYKSNYCFSDVPKCEQRYEVHCSRHAYNSKLRACRLLLFTDAQVEAEIETSADWVKFSALLLYDGKKLEKGNMSIRLLPVAMLLVIPQSELSVSAGAWRSQRGCPASPGTSRVQLLGVDVQLQAEPLEGDDVEEVGQRLQVPFPWTEPNALWPPVKEQSWSNERRSPEASLKAVAGPARKQEHPHPFPMLADIWTSSGGEGLGDLAVQLDACLHRGDVPTAADLLKRAPLTGMSSMRANLRKAARSKNAIRTSRSASRMDAGTLWMTVSDEPKAPHIELDFRSTTSRSGRAGTTSGTPGAAVVRQDADELRGAARAGAKQDVEVVPLALSEEWQQVEDAPPHLASHGRRHVNHVERVLNKARVLAGIDLCDRLHGGALAENLEASAGDSSDRRGHRQLLPLHEVAQPLELRQEAAHAGAERILASRRPPRPPDRLSSHGWVTQDPTCCFSPEQCRQRRHVTDSRSPLRLIAASPWQRPVSAVPRREAARDESGESAELDGASGGPGGADEQLVATQRHLDLNRERGGRKVFGLGNSQQPADEVGGQEAQLLDRLCRVHRALDKADVLRGAREVAHQPSGVSGLGGGQAAGEAGQGRSKASLVGRGQWVGDDQSAAEDEQQRQQSAHCKVHRTECSEVSLTSEHAELDPVGVRLDLRLHLSVGEQQQAAGSQLAVVQHVSAAGRTCCTRGLRSRLARSFCFPGVAGSVRDCLGRAAEGWTEDERLALLEADGHSEGKRKRCDPGRTGIPWSRKARGTSAVSGADSHSEPARESPSRLNQLKPARPADWAVRMHQKKQVDEKVIVAQATTPFPAKKNKKGKNTKTKKQRDDSSSSKKSYCTCRALIMTQLAEENDIMTQMARERESEPLASDSGTQAPESGPQAPDSGPQKPDSGPQKPDNGPKKPDSGPQTPDSGPQTPDSGPPTPDSGLQTSDSGPQTPDSGPPTPDSGPQTSDSGPQTPDSGPPTPDSGSQASERRPQASERRPQASGSGAAGVGRALPPLSLVSMNLRDYPGELPGHAFAFEGDDYDKMKMKREQKGEQKNTLPSLSAPTPYPAIQAKPRRSPSRRPPLNSRNSGIATSVMNLELRMKASGRHLRSTGHLLYASCIVKTYLLPRLLVGNGPIKSTITLSNALLLAMGSKGALRRIRGLLPVADIASPHVLLDFPLETRSPKSASDFFDCFLDSEMSSTWAAVKSLQDFADHSLRQHNPWCVTPDALDHEYSLRELQLRHLGPKKWPEPPATRFVVAPDTALVLTAALLGPMSLSAVCAATRSPGSIVPPNAVARTAGQSRSSESVMFAKCTGRVFPGWTKHTLLANIGRSSLFGRLSDSAIPNTPTFRVSVLRILAEAVISWRCYAALSMGLLLSRRNPLAPAGVPLAVSLLLARRAVRSQVSRFLASEAANSPAFGLSMGGVFSPFGRPAAVTQCIAFFTCSRQSQPALSSSEHFMSTIFACDSCSDHFYATASHPFGSWPLPLTLCQPDLLVTLSFARSDTPSQMLQPHLRLGMLPSNCSELCELSSSPPIDAQCRFAEHQLWLAKMSTGDPESPRNDPEDSEEGMSDPVMGKMSFVAASQNPFLDISAMKVKAVPDELLSLTHLQFLYMAFNGLAELPADFFSALPNVKWLDLRGNRLRALPTLDLGSHAFLEYLLLEDNCISRLPIELGFVKSLRGLALSGNPLDFPHTEILSAGVASIAAYLREVHSGRLEIENRLAAEQEAGWSTQLDDDPPAKPSPPPSSASAESRDTRKSLKAPQRRQSPKKQQQQQLLTTQTAPLHRQEGPQIRQRVAPPPLARQSDRHRQFVREFPEPPAPGLVERRAAEERRNARRRETLARQEAVLQRRRDAEASRQWREEARRLQMAAAREQLLAGPLAAARNSDSRIRAAPFSAGGDPNALRLPSHSELHRRRDEDGPAAAESEAAQRVQQHAAALMERRRLAAASADALGPDGQKLTAAQAVEAARRDVE